MNQFEPDDYTYLFVEIILKLIIYTDKEKINKKYMPQAGLEPGTTRSTVHCLIRYATKEDTLKLMKKLKLYNCKGDKSIPPHALV